MKLLARAFKNPREFDRINREGAGREEMMDEHKPMKEIEKEKKKRKTRKFLMYNNALICMIA